MSSKVEELITRFSVDDKYTAAVKKIASATHKLQASTSSSGGGGKGSTGGMGGFFDGFAGSLRFAASEMDSAIPGLQEVLGVLKGIAITAGAAGAAMLGFGIYAMHTAAELEALKLGLKAYSSTQEDFERNLKRLQEVARLPGLGFAEAIQGSTRLQAAGLDARLAERAMLGFGNALAASGGGKEELDGVILALTQIASKAQVSAEEINQINERVPQIRRLMLEAFGTASTEELAKRGISPQDFILKIIDSLETLPRAMGGAKNAFENFGDIAFRITAQIGQALNDNFLPPLSRIADLFDFLESKNFFGNVAKGILDSIGGMGTFEQIALRVTALLAAAGEKLPQLFKGVMDVVQSAIDRIKENLSTMIDTINSIIDGIEEIMNSWIGKRLRGSSEDKDLGRLLNPFKNDIGVGVGSGIAQEAGIQGLLGSLFGEIGARADEILNEFSGFGSGDGLNDPSKGGFTFSTEDSLSQIAKATRQTALNTDALKEIKDVVLGGTGRYNISPTDMRGIKRGRRGKGTLEDAIHNLVAAVRMEANGAVLDNLLSRASRGL